MGPPAARAQGKSQRSSLEAKRLSAEGLGNGPAGQEPGVAIHLAFWLGDRFAMATVRCSRGHREPKKEHQQQDSLWPSRRPPPEATLENTVLLRRKSRCGTVRARVKKEETVEQCIHDYIWGQHLLPKYTTW